MSDFWVKLILKVLYPFLRPRLLKTVKSTDNTLDDNVLQLLDIYLGRSKH
jgi:hypothetical protein